MEYITPRPAATIVIIRNQNRLLEILMLRRSARVAAAPGAHVFPGGSVDEIDYEVLRRGLVVGRDVATAARRLDLADGALAYYCAAVRELFEEAGLLLVRGAADAAPPPTHVEVTRWRAQVRDGAVSWPDLLDREGLRLALGELEYLAHWVTPEGRPRRFDTRFFVARAPADQPVLVDEGEIVEHVWTSARGALERVAAGEWDMLVPTVRTLRSLDRYDAVEGVLEDAATRRVTRIQPIEVERDGRLVVVVPGEDDEGRRRG